MLDVKLLQEQRFRLAITPEMKRSIHLLTLSNQDLVRYLLDAADANPLLEVEGHSAPLARLPRSMDRRKHDGYEPLLQARGAEPTLEHSLAAQVRLLGLPPALTATAEYLAGCVNDDGYLMLDLTEAASALGISVDEAAAGLEIVQSLDPAGVGARSLQECLLLQIRRASIVNRHAERMVEAGLAELVPFHPGKAGARLAMTASEAKSAYDYITRLDPKPCRSIGCTEPPHYVIPDAIAELRDGEVRLEFHSAGNLRLSMNEACFRWVRHGGTGEVWTEWAVEARAIIRSVQLRRKTLMRVLAAVMEEQELFLHQGPSGLKPLNLAMIAEKIGVHESTVSRAVQGKYIQTPHGMFEWKAFFAAAIGTDDGDRTSAAAAKWRLKELIRMEQADRPHSDSRLAELLAGEGIVVSRRTVAKYREELRILPSRERQRRG